jgi:hypothetical protein
MRKVTIFTIGFCGKKENEFHDFFNNAGGTLLLDIRLRRVARFVPWASGDNLEIAFGRRDQYVSECAPTIELLKTIIEMAKLLGQTMSKFLMRLSQTVK